MIARVLGWSLVSLEHFDMAILSTWCSEREAFAGHAFALAYCVSRT
jgi:hypothetical protein